MREINVKELKTLRDTGSPHLLLDVREPNEIAYAALNHAVCIPLREVHKRIDEFPLDRTIVVMCHIGKRSANIVKFLEQKGFLNVVHLTGGIDAWSRQIDPRVRTYDTLKLLKPSSGNPMGWSH